MTTAETLALLLPIAEKLLIRIGTKLIEINTSEMTHEELIEALKKSKSPSWPVLTFKKDLD